MSYTKGQIIEDAFAEIGFASYDFDIPAEKSENALRRLDAMMAEWDAKGIRLGYPLSSIPGNGELTDDSNIPDSAWEAVVTNLAKRLAPSVGKMVSPNTMEVARTSYNTILMRSAMPPQMQLPGSMPRGAGYKSTDYPFLNPPSDPLLAGPDGEIEFD
jgi:hypothetical protein